MERRSIKPGSNQSRRERETYRGKTEKKIEKRNEERRKKTKS